MTEYISIVHQEVVCVMRGKENELMVMDIRVWRAGRDASKNRGVKLGLIEQAAGGCDGRL